MVDCGNPRCAQERRFFKKELLSWSKKVPLMIALEQIAANYSDKEHSKQFANPYTGLERHEETDDWEADDCCFYCLGQLTNSLDHLEQLLQDARSGKLDADSSYVRSLQDLLPFYTRYYTEGVGRELLAELGSRPSHPSSSVASAQVSTISTHTIADLEDNELTSHTPHKPHVELKIPQLQGRGRKAEDQASTGIKRGYTDEELEAAVADIRGGKLGTRRASSLYGIPRSTLRNKIFRSGSDMDRTPAFLDPEDSNSGDEAMAAAVTNGMKMAELVQAGAFPFLPPVPIPLNTTLEEEQNYSKAVLLDEFSVKLEHIRRMHNLKGDRDLQIKPAHINEPKLPLLTILIRRLVEQRFQMELSGAHCRGREAEQNDVDMSSRKTSSPVKEEKKSTAISVDTLPHFLPYLPSFSPSCLSLSVPSSFEDLRIPSYKPANVQQQQREVDPADDDSRPFGKVYETSRIGETLKDIIVKSISEKMKFHDVDTQPLFPGASDLFSQTLSLTDAFPLDLGKSAFRSCHSDISQPTHPAKRIKREPCDDQDVQSHSMKSSSDSSRSKLTDYRGQGSGESKSNNSQSAGSSNSTKSRNDGSVKEKKTRPKRGQYRKYNSQLLIEAVRAVQRGEMSVHRAGSYFGVPHSTLEYKVKERHLLRQKKPREGSSTSSGSTTTTTASVSSTSSSITTVTTASSTTQTSKASLVTSTQSSDSSTSSASSSSQTPLGASSKAETALPLSSSPSSSLSALGFGLHKQAGAGGEFPWFQPYLVSGASPSPFDPALSLFPQGFALNTSASELLRKLQHKVQSKSSPSSPFSSESSFGFAHPNGSSSMRESFLLFN